MMARMWRQILKEDGVKIHLISPSLLATGLGGDSEALKGRGANDPMQGGILVMRVIEGEMDSFEGKVVNSNGEVQPW